VYMKTLSWQVTVWKLILLSTRSKADSTVQKLLFVRNIFLSYLTNIRVALGDSDGA